MIKFDAVRLSGLTDINLPIFGLGPEDPFQVAAIDGLGPTDLDVLIAENHAPGGIFINRRAQGREIVIRLKLNPDYKIGQTVGDLRYALYGLLSPGVDPKNQSITVSLLNLNAPVVQTVGYVKRIEIVPFDQNPQAQITIVCLSPYLEASEIEEIVPSSATFNVDNLGLAPTGFKFSITITQALTNWTLSLLGGGSMVFDFSSLVDPIWGPNAVLVVDTSQANRQVYFNDFVITAGFELLTPDSDWLFLRGGEHQFTSTAPGPFAWNYFRYRPQFWGI